MIQIIAHWQGDWSLIDKEVTPYNTHIAISEMIDGWLILLDDTDELDALEIAMEEQDNLSITGAFNMDGSVFLYGNGVRDYTITKYTDKLHPKKVYDENGDLVSETPYDEITALDKQVNLIAGHNNRILN